MLKTVFESRFFVLAIASALLLIALVCVFTPDVFVLKQSANFTAQIMLGYLLAGMFFFLLNRPKLVLTSFLCCGILCIHLKQSSNGHLILAAKTEEPELKVGLLNLSLAEDYYATMESIVSTEVDIWVFQEITPDWYHVIDLALCEDFPHEAAMLRIDPYGMVYFSSIPIEEVDTFYHAGIPNLRASVSPNHRDRIHLISTHTMAPVNSDAYRQIREHFRTVSRYMAGLDGPVITCGDYNLPSWAIEIKEYKALAQLRDSRRDIIPASDKGSLSIFRVPIDHIFFTEDVECTSFRAIQDQRARHIGVSGSYQMKKSEI